MIKQSASTPPTFEPLLEVRNLTKIYAGADTPAIHEINLNAWAGETIALLGPSGCGKTTFLNLLGVLDSPTTGQICYWGEPVTSIHRKHAFRARHLGFVFQFHHLLPTMTLAENIEAPLIGTGMRGSVRKDRVNEVLTHVGLCHRGKYLPANVSGGERQRAALARAIVNRPTVVLADEPTGNLDIANGQMVFELLVQLARQQGSLVFVATHNPSLALKLQRQVRMVDGRISEVPTGQTHSVPS